MNCLLKSFRDLIKKITPSRLSINFLRKVYHSTWNICLWKKISIFIDCWKFLYKNSKNKYLHLTVSLFIWKVTSEKKKKNHSIFFTHARHSVTPTYLTDSSKLAEFPLHSIAFLTSTSSTFFRVSKKYFNLFQPLPAYQNNNRHSFLLITTLTLSQLSQKYTHLVFFLSTQILNKHSKRVLVFNFKKIVGL